MKTFVLLWLLACSPPAWAEDSSPPEKEEPIFIAQALGVNVGDPFGLSGKGWLNKEMAIDAGLGFALKRYWLLYSDLLYHLDMGWPGWIPYGGLGLSIAFPNHKTGGIKGESWSGWAVALRSVIGVEWLVSRGRFGIYLEVAPVYPVIPFRKQAESVFVQGGLGGRFYF